MKRAQLTCISASCSIALVAAASASIPIEPEDALFTINGAVEHGQLGSSVAPAGDFNNDGVPDFIVTSRKSSIPEPEIGPVLYIYSGADASLLHSVAGGVSNEEFYAIGIGDTNDDDFDDVVVRHRNGPVDVVAYVISGQTHETLYSIPAEKLLPGNFSTFIEPVGDANGDNITDFAIAAPSFDTVFVYSGLDGSILHTFTEPSENEFGRSIDGSGDINNDGVNDLVVGMWPFCDRGGRCFDTTVYVYSLADGSTIHTLPGDLGFAFTVGVIGDIDDDGHDDFMTGPYHGSVILSGQTGTTIRLIDPASQNSIVNLGDIDGDDIDDYMVDNRSYSGASGDPLMTLPFDWPSQYAVIGDITGNGQPDIVYSDPEADFTGVNTGQVQVFELPVIQHYGFDQQSPLVAGTSHSFTLESPVPAAGDVSLDFIAHADLQSRNEYVTVMMAGAEIGEVFVEDALECSHENNSFDFITVPTSAFNDAAGKGSVEITVTPNVEVDGTEHGCDAMETDPWIRLGVVYEPAVIGDLDGDGVVGPADLAQLLGVWGPCADPRDCSEDLNGDGAVGPADLALLLGSWG